MHTFQLQKQENYFKKAKILLLIIKFAILRPESEIVLPYMIIITSNTFLPTRLFSTTHLLIFEETSGDNTFKTILILKLSKNSIEIQTHKHYFCK